nr:C40 family peptidase [Crenothrix polyspora]
MNSFWIKTNHHTRYYLYELIRFIGFAVVLVLFAGCASSPEIKPQIVRSSKSPVIDYALSLQGIPYRYGKSSPEEGFDCSGFVQHVYQHYGVALPRRASDMALALPEIPKYGLSSGDLVFFNTNGRPHSHVGIFIKDDKFIHAPSRRTGKVLVSSLNNRYWQKHFTGVRRPK